jgi:hypothetical protein
MNAVLLGGVRAAGSSEGARIGVPYWKQRGWTLRNGMLVGEYRAGERRVRGTVKLEPLEVLVHNPPPELRRHSHWQCFHSRGDGWYRVHLTIVPWDPSSAILYIERLLHESLKYASRAERERRAALDRRDELTRETAAPGRPVENTTRPGRYCQALRSVARTIWWVLIGVGTLVLIGALVGVAITLLLICAVIGVLSWLD